MSAWPVIAWQPYVYAPRALAASQHLYLSSSPIGGWLVSPGLCVANQFLHLSAWIEPDRLHHLNDISCAVL